MWRLLNMKPTQSWGQIKMDNVHLSHISLFFVCYVVRMRKWDTRLNHSETEMHTPLSKNSRVAWMQQQFGCKVSKNKSGFSAGLSQLCVFSSQSAISGSLYKYLVNPHISFTKYQGTGRVEDLHLLKDREWEQRFALKTTSSWHSYVSVPLAFPLFQARFKENTHYFKLRSLEASL